MAARGAPTILRGVSTMWAIRKVEAAPGLSLAQVPIPAPRAREVLVKVEAASVCGTDLHISNWDAWAQQRIKPPLTLGHEFAGTVVEIAPTLQQNDTGYGAPENWWDMTATIPNSAAADTVDVKCGDKTLAELKVAPKG